MKVFKFGGASVKDTQGVRNLGVILKKYSGEQLVVVVSAMGKTTNALEKIVKSQRDDETEKVIADLEDYHTGIAAEAVTGKWKTRVISFIQGEFNEIRALAKDYPKGDYDERYDQIVSYGERLSAAIVSNYLSEIGIPNSYEYACKSISTDDSFRGANVIFTETELLLKTNYAKAFEVAGIVVTEGFIGRNSTGKTTTLGREGSDYTAAIIGYCLNAESVTIWKDVPGVLNADPKWFDNTVKIDHLSYQDALELSYYGATVIHPKTIKPLQNKGIPLFVKSFLAHADPGTCIDNESTRLPVPCFIFKVNQVLLSISPKDFSFIVEENLSRIFKALADCKAKVNVMQNSALNFSICMDDDAVIVPAVVAALKEDFRVLYNRNLELVTIRYYDQPTIDRVCIGKKVLMEHKSRYTVQLVVSGTS